MAEKFCFYCSRHKPSADKRRGYPRQICNECVEIRERKNDQTHVAQILMSKRISPDSGHNQ